MWGLCGKVLVVGGVCSGGFYEKTPGAAPMLDRTVFECLHNVFFARPVSDVGSASSLCVNHSLPFLIPLHCSGEEEVEQSNRKFSLERKKEWGKGVCSLVFISHYPALLLIDNKLN